MTKAPYVPKAWETVNCLICGSDQYSVYERFGSEFQYTYVLCKSCGLVYTNPRPRYDQDFINHAYASYYQFSENIKLSDLNNVNESSLKMFEEEVDHLITFDKQKKAVLDIGTGMGTFLLAAKKYYSRAEGIDVSEQMAAFVEKNIGVKVHVLDYTQFLPEEKFSLIHMSHVLEHIPNPHEWIAHSRKLLLPGGILVINVPNKKGISHVFKHVLYKLGIKKQFSASWKDPSRTPDHLIEPTLNSMLYLLKQHNFEVLSAYSYSRRDPVSNKTFFSRLLHRGLKRGSNLTFITRPREAVV